MDEQKSVVRTTNLTEYAIDIASVGKQTAMVQELLTKIMKGPSDDNPNGLHYGLIPGCGPKPVLLQPGAQKICQTFQIHCETVERTQLDLPNNHREVRFRVAIKTNANGMVIGEGVGTCTTMEKKYRYRRGSDIQITDQEVPRAFWDLDRSQRYDEPGWKILGGKDRVVKKEGGKWFIAIKGAEEPEEYPNPADYWNTIEKIGYKRAQMHAVINATACSDIFEQDLEYLKELMEADDIIDVSAAEYHEQPAPQKSEQQQMDMSGKKEKPATEVTEEKSEPEKKEEPKGEPEKKEPPAEKPEPSEPKDPPASEPKEDTSKLKGPTGKPVSSAPAKPTGDAHASTEYAQFITECFQANIEQTVNTKMLERAAGKTVEEGWTESTVKQLMGVYAHLAKNPDPEVLIAELRQYFPGYYD